RRQLVAGTMVAVATSATGAGAAQTPTGSAASEAGTVWWSELLTRDPARARAFYAGVVGWTTKVVALEDPARPAKPGEKEYVLFTTEGREAAGAMKLDDAGLAGASAWLPYIQVADVDAAAAKAVELGGKLLSGPFDVQGSGRMATIEDPDGARVGLITPEAR
ncbi:MAG: VOC family protein, partial [Candidatus Rokuibacteriota bacterium]